LIELKRSGQNADLVGRLKGQVKALMIGRAGTEPYPSQYPHVNKRLSTPDVDSLLAKYHVTTTNRLIPVPIVAEKEIRIAVYDPKQRVISIEPTTGFMPAWQRQDDGRPGYWDPVDSKPKFFPTYQTLKYDRASLIASNYLWSLSGGGAITEKAKDLYFELSKLAGEHYFGAFGPEGQMIRFKAVRDVFEWAQKVVSKNHLAQPCWDIILPSNSAAADDGPVQVNIAAVMPGVQDYTKVMGRLFPFSTLPPLYDSQRNPTSYFRLDSLKFSVIEKLWDEYWQNRPPFKLMEISKDSTAGLLYGERTHKEVFPSELLMAQGLLSTLSQLPLTGGDESKAAVSTFWKQWGFLKLARLKPKPEVYERPREPAAGEGTDMILTKVRNICAVNVLGGLPLKLIFALSYKLSPNFLQHPTSRHMLGWTPFHGGVDQLFNYVFVRACTPRTPDAGRNDIKLHSLVFSDNIYVFYFHNKHLVWISLDGAKMEASQKTNELMLEATRLFLGLTTPAEGGVASSLLSPAYINYLFRVYPDLTTRLKAVWGSSQFDIPGMGSGSVGTGYNNTYKMMTVAQIVVSKEFRIASVSQPADIAAEVAKYVTTQAEGCGIKLTTECTTIFDLTSMTGLKDPKSMRKALVEKYANTTVSLDLLGYNSYIYSNGEHSAFLPALARDRLLKSMLFHKTEFYAKTDHAPEVRDIIRFIIMKTLYIIGGYAYEEISLILRHMIKTISLDTGLPYNLLSKVVGDSEALQSTLESLQDGLQHEEALKQEAGIPSLPTIETILRISGPGSGYTGPYGVVAASQLTSTLAKATWRQRAHLFVSEYLAASYRPKDIETRHIAQHLFHDMTPLFEGKRLHSFDSGEWADSLAAQIFPKDVSEESSFERPPALRVQRTSPEARAPVNPALLYGQSPVSMQATSEDADAEASQEGSREPKRVRFSEE